MNTMEFLLHISRKSARFESSKNTPQVYDRIGRGGDECSGFKNPIGRTFLSGNRIFAETGKSRLSEEEERDGRMDRRGN